MSDELPPEATEALVQFRAAMQADLRALETDVLLERYRFARSIGTTFNGRRDLYQILGYEEALTVEHYRERYERGGIAGTVVDLMPNSTWNGAFELIEDPEKLDKENYTPFETEWNTLAERLSVSSYLRKVDILSRLSTYAVLLIGNDGGTPLAEELPKGKGKQEGITFLQPFVGGGGWRMSGMRSNRARMRVATSDSGADATIKDWVTDVKDKRFGQPKSYMLKRVDFSAPEEFAEVHWSRIIHVAENTLDDDVFGPPVLARCWNLFDDLNKVAGGGAEAFWLRANRGMQLDFDKTMSNLGEPEKQEVRDQAEKYQHELTRIMRTRGITIKELGSDVANFSDPGDFILSLIAGTARVPKRILTGSEMGELASTQDRENFRDTVGARQSTYAGPFIVRRLAQRLIDFNYLPAPKQYQVIWPKTEVMTETERAQGALRWAQVNVACKNANTPPAFTVDEIRDKWYGLEPIPDDVLKKMSETAQSLAPPPPPMLAPGEKPGQTDEEEKPFPRAASAR